MFTRTVVATGCLNGLLLLLQNVHHEGLYLSLIRAKVTRTKTELLIYVHIRHVAEGGHNLFTEAVFITVSTKFWVNIVVNMKPLNGGQITSQFF